MTDKSSTKSTGESPPGPMYRGRPVKEMSLFELCDAMTTCAAELAQNVAEARKGVDALIHPKARFDESRDMYEGYTYHGDSVPLDPDDNRDAADAADMAYEAHRPVPKNPEPLDG